jgi:hypothetical protein
MITHPSNVVTLNVTDPSVHFVHRGLLALRIYATLHPHSHLWITAIDKILARGENHA